MWNNPNPKQQRGFTLVEVLIAMLLLAIGVLGLAGAQLGALKYNQTASGRTQASFLAYSIADAMRANKKNAASYVIALNPTVPTGTSIAEVDLKNWLVSLSTQLPAGTGSITCSCGASETSYAVTITVRWDEGRNAKTDSTDTASDTTSTQSFVMVTQI